MNHPAHIPQTAIDSASVESSAQRKMRAEEDLTSLWRSARLGVHIFEHHKGLEFPTYSQKGFSALQGQSTRKICEHYETGKTPLISFSTIPPKGPHFAPFHMGSALESRLGYMLDLRQEIKNPATIVRVCESDIGSGFDFYDKNLYIHTSNPLDNHSPLDAFYHGKNETDFIHSVGRLGSTLSEDQLNLLHNYYKKPLKIEPSDPYNEVIAAISNDHIRAVVCFISSPRPCKDTTYEKTLCTMGAALSAIDHIHHGIDVPAVLYHLGTPREQAVECIGQGEAELKEVARQAMVELYANHYEQLYSGLLGWHDIIKRAAEILKIPEKKLDKQIQKEAKEIASNQR